MQEMDYDLVTSTCLEEYARPEATPLGLLEKLMDLPGVPMHDPVHHYIMPAMLLTMAARSRGLGQERLKELLETAEQRARKLLPGFCGWWGACGAAVGCGVFASVWTGASPKIEANWAKVNQFTARCLGRVASVDGPRCCKRTSFLALTEAIPAARELLGLELGEAPDPACSWSAYNRECRQDGCPFYHRDKARAHASLFQGLDAAAPRR